MDPFESRCYRSLIVTDIRWLIISRKINGTCGDINYWDAVEGSGIFFILNQTFMRYQIYGLECLGKVGNSTRIPRNLFYQFGKQPKPKKEKK
ncbi:hypothetical protein NQ315_009849 [Exocentrus adspersus]|uniref:Uncharacterized protein n=1 Tax=Exocentrus adspersus TaxID=1586481 RepID=A0AAV8WHH1_9CUCU|nr:hypothetical protein NQ315_009849 [Exocentrus adspersus]